MNQGISHEFRLDSIQFTSEAFVFKSEAECNGDVTPVYKYNLLA